MTGHFITKNGKPIFIDDNRKSTKTKTVHATGIKTNNGIKNMDIASMLSEAEIQEWEKTARSEVIGVKHEHVDGLPVMTVMFQNKEEWFEFHNFQDQESFFDKNFDGMKGEIGEYIKVDHPIVEGFVELMSGKKFFEEKMEENGGDKV